MKRRAFLKLASGAVTTLFLPSVQTGQAAPAFDDAPAIQAALDAACAAGGGDVILPAGTYQLDAGLVIHEQVALAGVGAGMTNHSAVVLNYTGAGTAITASLNGPGSYAAVRLAGFELRNLSAGTVGIYLDQCRAALEDVTIKGFSGQGLKILGGINSAYRGCVFADCGVGAEIATGKTTTSQTFTGCYFSGGERCFVAGQCNSVLFDGLCIFESCSGDAITLDGVSMAAFYAPYLENVGGRGWVVGESEACQGLIVDGALVIGGAYNDPTADLFCLDRVENADLSLADCPCPKATKLRTTANTGGVRYRADDYQITGVSYTPRASDTAYVKGAGIIVTVNGKALYFVCVVGGTSANSQPGEYAYGAYRVTDGAAVFQWSEAECVADWTQTVVTRRNNQSVRGTQDFQYSHTGRWRWGATYNTVNGEFMLSNLNRGTKPISVHPQTDVVRLGSSAWDGGHLQMGNYHLWVDGGGALRIKPGAPTSDGDGAAV